MQAVVHIFKLWTKYRKIVNKMPAKCQHFDLVKKNANKEQKNFFEKLSVSRADKKD